MSMRSVRQFLLISLIWLTSCETPIAGTTVLPLQDAQDTGSESVDTLFRDTVITDEGTMIRTFASFPGSIDSIEVRLEGRPPRALRLNDGGYQGSHTWLRWSNDRFLCFGFGCGSPCWGVQLVDPSASQTIIERMYTVHADSVRNVLCYPDTGYSKDGQVGFVLENLLTGRRHCFHVAMEPVAVPALAFDSSWVTGTRLLLRRTGDHRTEAVDMNSVL